MDDLLSPVSVIGDKDEAVRRDIEATDGEEPWGECLLRVAKREI